MMYESNPVGIDYYYEEVDTEKVKGDMAITNMINCYKENNDLDNIYLHIGKNIKELEQFYQKNNKHFAFLYQDLFS